MWRAVWAIMFATLLLILVCSTAMSNGLVLFDGSKIDVGDVLFGCATVVLTGVGVVVALLALWGFGEIRTKAIEAAASESHEVAEEVAKDIASSVSARIALEAVQPGIDRVELALQRLRANGLLNDENEEETPPQNDEPDATA